MQCKLFCYRTAWHYVDALKESLTWCHIIQSLQHPKHASKQWWENCNYAVLFRKMKKQIEDAAKARFWVNRKMTGKLKYILRKHSFQAANGRLFSQGIIVSEEYTPTNWLHGTATCENISPEGKSPGSELVMLEICEQQSNLCN